MWMAVSPSLHRTSPQCSELARFPGGRGGGGNKDGPCFPACFLAFAFSLETVAPLGGGRGALCGSRDHPPVPLCVCSISPRGEMLMAREVVHDGRAVRLLVSLGRGAGPRRGPGPSPACRGRAPPTRGDG